MYKTRSDISNTLIENACSRICASFFQVIQKFPQIPINWDTFFGAFEKIYIYIVDYVVRVTYSNYHNTRECFVTFFYICCHNQLKLYLFLPFIYVATVFKANNIDFQAVAATNVSILIHFVKLFCLKLR